MSLGIKNPLLKRNKKTIMAIIFIGMIGLGGFMYYTGGTINSYQYKTTVSPVSDDISIDNSEVIEYSSLSTSEKKLIQGALDDGDIEEESVYKEQFSTQKTVVDTNNKIVNLNGMYTHVLIQERTLTELDFQSTVGFMLMGFPVLFIMIVYGFKPLDEDSQEVYY